MSTTNELTQQIITTLYSLGIFSYRQNVMAIPMVRDKQLVGFRPPPTAGIPDLQVVVPRGKSTRFPTGSGYIGIEIKNSATKDKIRPSQISFQANARAGGDAVIIIVTSFEDFINQITPILDLCHIPEKFNLSNRAKK